jgi:hypothetical protein
MPCVDTPSIGIDESHSVFGVQSEVFVSVYGYWFAGDDNRILKWPPPAAFHRYRSEPIDFFCAG